jgi:YidC/Oxa1 family membrane protein insertase
MILAIVLSVAVLIGYQYFISPPATKGPAAPASKEAGREAGRDNAVTTAVPAPGAQAVSAGVPGAGQGGGLAPKVQHLPRRIAVTTPLYQAAIATDGAGIASFSLKNYNDVVGPAGKPLDIIGFRSGRPLPLDVSLEESQPGFPLLPVFSTDSPSSLTVGKGEKTVVRLTWESQSGVRMDREFVFHGDRYDFDVNLQIVNRSRETVRVRPGLELAQDYRGELSGDSYTFSGAVVDTRGKIEQIDLKTIGKGKVPKYPIRWVAADEKYFSLIFLPEKEWTLEKAALVGETGIRLAAAGAPATLAPGESLRESGRAFLGPKRFDLLKQTGKDLEELVDYGWFSFLAKPLVWLMNASNKVTRNYGIDIIVLTILIKILFYPLTQKSMASMKKMQDLTPVLAKLREKYKSDPAKLNQETMNLYKTYKINPLSGCLPMLLQIPVFIALYKGLLVTIELRHSPFLLWINDLSAPEHLWDIPVAGYAIPIRLLPLLMGISMFVQQKMTPAAGDPNQQKIMLLMPVIFTFMFWGFPTGLVIYWLVNNVLSIGQQLIHNRQAEAAKARPA